MGKNLKSKHSTTSFLAKIESMAQQELISEKFKEILKQFFQSYEATLEADGISISSYESIFITFLERLEELARSPYTFQPYNERIRAPFDYYQFGIDFIKPLIDMRHSSVRGEINLSSIIWHLSQKHNVILLANHQTEADPQAINILLEKNHPKLAEEMIFVAGERVVTDPLTIPFGMGLNLLCIYSKRYIDHPPELKMKKQHHNKRTMELMSKLLSEGGKCIYVAPSGGRDRPNKQGIVEVAPFDPQSLEMLHLMAQKSGHPTFFFPMALKTFYLLPPPQTIQVELGEARVTKRGASHLAFGPEIDMENFPGSSEKDKHARRKLRADYIWKLVADDYTKFPE